MSTPIDLFVDRRQVFGGDPVAGLSRADGSDLASALAAFVERRAGAGAVRARVWLGGDVCRPFLFPVVAGLRDRDERERAAQAMAPERTALSAPLRLWLEDGAATGARAAAAMTQADYLQTMEALRRARVRPASLAPWWSAALGAALRARPGLRAFAAFDGVALVVATGEGGAFSALECMAPVDAEAARAAWRRRLFAGGVDDADAAWAALDARVAGGADAPDGLPLRAYVQWAWGGA